jgi:Raf kinase inhibitor-like YbhB/YbcL family protein
MRPETDGPSLGPRILRVGAIVAAALGCLLAFLLLAQHSSTSSEVQAGPSIKFRSTSFANSASIPSRYTCDGADVSPGLEWSGAPPGTKSFALVMHDPDAPVDFTHWLAYDIPSGVDHLSEGASNDGAMPKGSAEGVNSFRRIGYGGPCPPAGKPHHYIFLFYALDADPGLPAGATREQLESAMRGHIVATGRLNGSYKRRGD